MDYGVISVTVLLLVYNYRTAAQDGGCSPSPPSTLISSSGRLLNNNVPIIDAQEDILQPIVGGHRTDIMGSVQCYPGSGAWSVVSGETR